MMPTIEEIEAMRDRLYRFYGDYDPRVPAAHMLNQIAQSLTRDTEDALRYRKLAKVAHWEDERDMGPGGRYWISVLVSEGNPTFNEAIDSMK
jgi:hypothetical protein